MDAIVRSVKTLVLLLIPPVLAILIGSYSPCVAGGPATHGTGCWPFVDGATLCAWQRTWHGPNTLARPLRRYYIPRTPAWCCGCNGYAAQCEGAMVDGYVVEGEVDAYATEEPLPLEPEMGREPVRFERLGQLPNDLGFAPGMPEAERRSEGR